MFAICVIKRWLLPNPVYVRSVFFFFFSFLFSPFCFILPKLLWFTEQATAKMNHYSMFEIMKWKN